MTGDIAAVRITVQGRVQGVGFRFFVQDVAQSLGLRGFVRNLNDGRSVEVVAEGARSSLEALISELRKGPPQAYVQRVDDSWGEATDGYEAFSIR